MDPALTYQLCLDLGKKSTGYAGMDCGRLDFYGKVGHRHATDAELFRRTLKMLKALDRQITNKGKMLGCISFEAAERQAGRAAEVYFTMATAVKVFAEQKGVPAFKVYSSSIKKTMTGDGGAEKRSVIHHVNKRYGLDLDEELNPSPDSDIADAIATGFTAMDMYRRDMLRPSP